MFEDISKRNIPGGEKERGREREKGEQCLWGGEGRGKGRTEGIYIYIYILNIQRRFSTEAEYILYSFPCTVLDYKRK